MSIAAIIAEYNPFYSGHQYQIREIRRKLGEDTKILALMSGDFVQRGEPAVMDKYLRAKLALYGGVSAVGELPVWMATASAADFAEGAVRILNALGCVDWLCCGVEHDNLKLLEGTAEIFLEEPEAYRLRLKEYLAQGQSFPVAREAAFLRYLEETGDCFYEEERDAGFLRLPNNILAISYLQALKKTGSRIRMLPIRRLGSYHSNPAQHGSEADPRYPGATAIRRELIRQRESGQGEWQLPEALVTSPEARELLQAQAGQSWPMAPEDLFLPVKLALSMRERELSAFADVSEDMARRLEKGWLTRTSMEDLADYLHTANYTRSRACRALLHILLGIRREAVQDFKDKGWAFYLRVLGFRKQDEDLIRTMSASPEIPVLLRAKMSAETENSLSREALLSYQYDIDAADRYELLRGMVSRLSAEAVREYSRAVIKT